MLNDLCNKTTELFVLLFKILIKIINLNLFIPCAASDTIQRKASFLCLYNISPDTIQS